MEAGRQSITETELRASLKKLMNKVALSTVDTITKQFMALGLGTADGDTIDMAARIVIEHTVGKGLFLEAFGLLVQRVSEQCRQAGQPRDFCLAVVAAFQSHMTMFLNTPLEPGAVSKTSSAEMRNKLIVGLRMIGDFFLEGACSAEAVGEILRNIGFLDVNTMAGAQSAAQEPDAAMPRCMMTNGELWRIPATQPLRDDTVTTWRLRLAEELGLPPGRIDLFAGGSRVPLSTRLADFGGDATLQVMVWNPALEEEHRIEAVCALLKKVGRGLEADVEWRHLVAEMDKRLEEMRPLASKRCQFIIDDYLKPM